MPSVFGASIAGRFTARALPDTTEQATVLDRYALPTGLARQLEAAQRRRTDRAPSVTAVTVLRKPNPHRQPVALSTDSAPRVLEVCRKAGSVMCQSRDVKRSIPGSLRQGTPRRSHTLHGTRSGRPGRRATRAAEANVAHGHDLGKARGAERMEVETPRYRNRLHATASVTSRARGERSQPSGRRSSRPCAAPAISKRRSAPRIQQYSRRGASTEFSNADGTARWRPMTVEPCAGAGSRRWL